MRGEGRHECSPSHGVGNRCRGRTGIRVRRAAVTNARGVTVVDYARERERERDRERETERERQREREGEETSAGDKLMRERERQQRVRTQCTPSAVQGVADISSAASLAIGWVTISTASSGAGLLAVEYRIARVSEPGVVGVLLAFVEVVGTLRSKGEGREK